MAVNELNGSYSTFTNDQKQKLLPHVSQCYGKWIPLYTHPVEEQDTDCQYCKQGCIRCDARKQLTDEEIEKIAEEFKDVDYTLDDEEAFDVFNHRGFARAILRKAQEK